MSIAYDMGGVSSRLQRNTVNRKTANKRQVMRTICEDYGNYIDEDSLEDQFDACVDFYWLVSIEEEESHCICGHDVYYNYIVTRKSEEKTKEFVIGSDCIRLFGQDLIEYTHSLKVIQEGKRVPPYFSTLFNNPTEVIKAIQEHLPSYRVGNYDEFRLVKSVKGKYKGMYRIIGLRYLRSTTTLDLGAFKEGGKGRVKFRLITSNKDFNHVEKAEIVEKTAPIAGLYDLPIASCDINAYNEIMYEAGIPEMNNLEIDFGKYKGIHLPELVVKNRGYAEWMLSKGIGSHEIREYLKEALNE